MNKQGLFLNTELGRKKSACLKVTARPVSTRNPLHLTYEHNLLMQMPHKKSAYKKIFCICVCIKFGPNQSIIQRRCCHIV